LQLWAELMIQIFIQSLISKFERKRYLAKPENSA